MELFSITCLKHLSIHIYEKKRQALHFAQGKLPLERHFSIASSIIMPCYDHTVISITKIIHSPHLFCRLVIWEAIERELKYMSVLVCDNLT